MKVVNVHVLKLEEICSIIDAHMRLNECIITKAILMAIL